MSSAISSSSSKPRLFIKPGCPWCTEAIEVLTRKQIAYETLNVNADPKALEEMRRLSGQSKVPTLDWNGEILADFGAAELLPFLAQRGL
jgi:glutaredoxin 3